MIRLVPDQSALIRRTSEVRFTFDGEPVDGHLGESVATALMRAGILNLRQAPNNGGQRGLFCCMGLCQECVVERAGEVVESCRLDVSEGLILNAVERA